MKIILHYLIYESKWESEVEPELKESYNDVQAGQAYHTHNKRL
jgi:hypothetical protein